ncbi:MAG TPA: FtsX-like permease family protein [Solirubrobacteraceae bacterium]|nr:FtsX-like permease family protein [Solirubrobacteraceae bacterium]
MTRLLLRTAVVNLRSRPLQTTLVAVIITAAAATLALALSLRAGAADPYNQIARATNAADVHVFAPSGSRADLAALAHAPGVRAADGPYDVGEATVRYGGSSVDMPFQAATSQRPRIDRPRLTSGRWLSGAPGELVLGRWVAQERGIAVGDRLTAIADGRRTALTVVGVAVSAGPTGPWVTRSTLAALAPARDQSGRLLELKLADRSKSAAFVDGLRRRYQPDQLSADDWRQDRQDVTDRTSTATVVLGSASLFALLAVGFIIANAITGRILASRRDIGLLKAAGFTPGGVTALFVVENLILALGAAIVGTAIGIALSPLLLEPTANLLGTATPSGVRPVTIAVGVLGVAAVVCVFTALPAWRAGRLGVLEAIALGRTSINTKPSRLARAATALRLPPSVVLGVKDAFASRSRAAMTIASLALTMATVVFALGAEATYRRVIHDSSLRAKPYELLVSTNDVSAPRMRALIAGEGGKIAGTATVAGTTASVPGHTVDIWARALGGDYERRPYAIRDGRMFAGPGEAIVGRGLLDALGLHVGDRLPLDAGGANVNLRIVGRYIEPDNDAMTAIFDERSVPPAALARFGPKQYELQLTDHSQAHAVESALLRASGGRLDVEATEDSVRQERDDLRPVLYGTEVVLLAIGLVNLLTTLLLGIRERVRDFGIFKVVGLTPRQVLASVTAGGTVLAVIAVVAGIVIGLPIFHALVVLTNPSDGPDLATAPTWWWVLLMLPGALLFTTLASVLPARRAAAIKPAEALRYE